MTKPDGKQTPAAKAPKDNAQAPQTSTAAAAPADNAGSVVQSAPPDQASQAQAPDQHHGRGGAYTRINGVRVPVITADTGTTEGENSNG